MSGGWKWTSDDADITRLVMLAVVLEFVWIQFDNTPMQHGVLRGLAISAVIVALARRELFGALWAAVVFWISKWITWQHGIDRVTVSLGICQAIVFAYSVLPIKRWWRRWREEPSKLAPENSGGPAC
jgi:hypothetical protein